MSKPKPEVMTLSEVVKEFGIFRQAIEHQIALGHLKVTRVPRHENAGPFKVKAVKRADVIALRKSGVLLARS